MRSTEYMLTTRLTKRWRWWIVGLAYVILLGWIIWINFPRSEYFTGWDALHPEFNLSANWQRALTAGWQEQYGVGALGGHGFAALLPHVITIWLISWLPMWSIRPVFLLGCYMLGGIGMLLFLRALLIPLTKQWRLGNYLPWVSGVGGLYYLLNLSTIQQFYVPLEAFVVQFALWPWCWLMILKILKQLTWRRLAGLALICLVGSMQGFIPSLFVAFMLGLAVYLLVWWWGESFRKSELKKVGAIYSTVILVNLYWLLPFGYYVFNNQSDFLSAYNNLVSTPEFVNKSLGYGDFKSVAFLKSFLLEGEQPLGKVFEPWLKHLDHSVVIIAGWLLVGVIGSGLIYGIFKCREPKIRALGIMTVVLFGMLAHAVFPFSLFWIGIQSLFPLFEQAFRTSFTKFGLGLAFGYAAFLSIGVLTGLRVCQRYFNSKALRFVWVSLVITAIIIWGWPVFTGNLYNRQLKVQIPNAYFQLMDYFNQEGEGRIAELPIECAEGWYTRPWGYYGSGFWWYGVKQPVLARTFDVWSRHNENFYWEALYALRQPDYSGLDEVLNKYQVKWVVLDPNLIHCSNENGLTYQQDLASYFEQHEGFQQTQKLSNSQLAEPMTIYQVTENLNEQFTEAPKTYAVVNSGVSGLEYDRAYRDTGDFIESTAEAANIYPWRGLFTQNLKRQGVDITENDRGVIVVGQEGVVNDGLLVIPSYEELERVMPVEVSLTASASGYVGTIKYLGPQVETSAGVVWDGQQSEQFGPVQVKDIQTLTLAMDNEPLVNLGGGKYVGAIFTNFNNSLISTDQGITNVWWQSGNSGVYQEMMQRQTIPIDQSLSELSVVLPKVNDSKRFGQVIKSENFPLPQDCSLEGVDGAARYEIAQGDGGLTRLISENDEICLRISLTEARPADGYVMTLSGKHIQGMMPRYNIYNWRGIRYQFGYLPSVQDGFKETFMIPPVFKTDQAYTFEVGNVSFSGTETINDIQRIEYWFVPYWFVQNIRIEQDSVFRSGNQTGGFRDLIGNNPSFASASTDRLPIRPFSDSDASEDGLLLNNLTINEVRKYGTSHYVVEIQGEGLLALSQGYDDGWMAISGGKLLPHVKVNGWENGWIIGDSQLETRDSSNNSLVASRDPLSSVFIVYWPQYLEWGGLLLLGIIGAGFLVKSAKSLLRSR